MPALSRFLPEVKYMQKYANKTFRDLWHRGKASFKDLDFVKCHFECCYLGEYGVSKRSTIENVHLVNCSQDRCYLEAPILRNVIVDGLNTKGQLLNVRGGAFDHVVLRGKIDRLRIMQWLGDIPQEPKFEAANAKIHGGVEWAVDTGPAHIKPLEEQGLR